MTTDETKSTDQLAVERTDLAAERTLMAADRTLMAWTRTALALISFGFTIYTLLQGFQGGEVGPGLIPKVESPRIMGLSLTGLGTVSMAMGTIEYWYRLKDLRRFASFRIWRPSFVMAIIMSLIGLSLFASISGKLL